MAGMTALEIIDIAQLLGDAMTERHVTALADHAKKLCYADRETGEN